jgi:hypothetical protein
MKDANGEKIAPLFAEDGVVELPFLHSVETEASLRRPQGIAGFYDVAKQALSGSHVQARGHPRPNRDT